MDDKKLGATSSETNVANSELLNHKIDQSFSAPQDQQISELKELTRTLMGAVQAMQSQSVRNTVFQDAIADVKSATRSMLTSPVATAYQSATAATGTKNDCGCESSRCTSCSCCTFEIWMSHVRADQMQLPVDIADSNILPTSVMEVWMFASIDPIYNLGACIPDPSPLSYLPLHKQITEPFGPWVNVNRLVGSVTVEKGTSKQIELSLTGVEREDALERTKPVNRDEWGSATENLTLDCCYTTYSPILVTVALSSWGEAGGTITGKFIVVKR